jgi:hypothetical protein
MDANSNPSRFDHLPTSELIIKLREINQEIGKRTLATELNETHYVFIFRKDVPLQDVLRQLASLGLDYSTTQYDDCLACVEVSRRTP